MKEKSIDALLKDLEASVIKLKDGNISIEDSIKIYNEGKKLQKEIEEKLEHIGKQININDSKE